MRKTTLMLVFLVFWAMALGPETTPAAPPQFLIYNYTFASGSEPDGFRGIKWQTDVATLDPLHTMEVIEIVGPFTYYRKNREDLRYGTADLTSVVYEFWNGQFSGVFLKVRGAEEFQKLKDYCFARFGEGQRSEVYARMQVQDFYYNGVKTRMTLKYSDMDREGELAMYSIALLSKQQRLDVLTLREKAREKIREWERARGK
jgi:hypothetical protein